LGETPAHKAARTGSMECISLLAAEQADLNVTSHSGLRPADLAARCGYVDCALYLQRAAEQQALKLSGIIDDVMLPVVQTQAVLPGQRPDKCIITQGINGGRLPNSIESQHIPQNNGLESDMDTEISPNSNATPPQGLNTHHPHEYQNGFGGNNINQRLMQSGFALQPKAKGISHVMNRVHQQDILLSHEVSSNMLPIAGRKRCREEVEDEPEEWKRVRRLETGGGDCPIQPQGMALSTNINNNDTPSLAAVKSHPFLEYLASRSHMF